jgi:glycosyltransferase involved in cell wall biosynthesis
MQAPIFISVVIPVYNQRAFLRQSVLSVLSESTEGSEIIVVDDCSSDGSVETVNDLPIKIIRLKQNSGGAAATNAGIRAAKANYIAFLDSDDVMVPGGLRWRVDWIRANPEVPIFAGRPAGIIDEEGMPLSQFRHVLHAKYTPPSVLTLDYFKNGGAYPVAQWLYVIRREVFERVGYFDERFKLAYDCEFLFRAMRSYDIPVVFQPVVLRRLHAANTSLSRASGDFQLSPETIATCEEIFSTFGIEATQWNLWERGFAD